MSSKYNILQNEEYSPKMVKASVVVTVGIAIVKDNPMGGMAN